MKFPMRDLLIAHKLPSGPHDVPDFTPDLKPNTNKIGSGMFLMIGIFEAAVFPAEFLCFLYTMFLPET